MVAQKRYMLFVGMLVLVGAGIYAKKNITRGRECTTSDNCLHNQNCQCYCSGIAGYRNKVDEDRPVYVEGDEFIDLNGEAVHCFCKEWDKEKFPGPAKRD